MVQKVKVWAPLWRLIPGNWQVYAPTCVIDHDLGRRWGGLYFSLLDGEKEQRKFTNSPARTGSIGTA